MAEKVEAAGPGVRRGILVGTMWSIVRASVTLFRLVVTALTVSGLLVGAVLFVNYLVLATPKARAYRDLDPSSDACRPGLERGWTILADVGRERLKVVGPQGAAGGWVDPSDDEAAIAEKDPAWATRFQCALQHHVIPATTPGRKPVEFHLGFLEFQEDGEPYALVSSVDDRTSTLTSGMLRHAMEAEMHAKRKAAVAVAPVITQLDVLKAHLSSGSNYVLIFIHGWRHDARIGDNNVADLRLYAAHAARFLAQRCETEHRYCDTKVTAIYVGWRGARVDELGLRNTFGNVLGGVFGNVSAAVTLFDRKPVSEAIAPAAVSALRSIQSVLASNREGPNKMVVAGHSLGGNMLATGLEDDLVKAARRHKFGETLPPVLGDLVVLINPAAEATKWTRVQREVWNRVAVHADANTSREDVLKDNGFFPDDQRPVVISLTAALAFPAGGLRPGDCAWIGLDLNDRFETARKAIRQRLANTDAMFDTGVEYDWATHDLFPTFKFDFRPAAAYLDRVAARIEQQEPHGQSCAPPRPVAWLDRLEALPVHALATLAATFPFQQSAPEDSHTIGNLDPPRPAAGVLADALPSAAPFGTTHELLGLHGTGVERHNPYATLADAQIDCPATNRWLVRARAKRRDQYGLFWDSHDLAPPQPDVSGQGEPAARFLHGLNLTGIAPITRANDPFWNVRAFDNALSRHDGYKLTSFICAMSQLVMDDITGMPAGLGDPMVDPDGPTVNPNP